MPRIFFTGFCCWQCIAFLRSELIKFCLLSCLSPEMWEQTPLFVYTNNILVQTTFKVLTNEKRGGLSPKAGKLIFLVSPQIANSLIPQSQIRKFVMIYPQIKTPLISLVSQSAIRKSGNLQKNSASDPDPHWLASNTVLLPTKVYFGLQNAMILCLKTVQKVVLKFE